jgi:hypothetical protein
MICREPWLIAVVDFRREILFYGMGIVPDAEKDVEAKLFSNALL